MPSLVFTGHSGVLETQVQIEKQDSCFLASAGNTIPHPKISIAQAYLFRIPAFHSKLFHQKSYLIPERKNNIYRMRSLNICGKLFKYPCIASEKNFINCLHVQSNIDQRLGVSLECVSTTLYASCLWDKNQLEKIIYI